MEQCKLDRINELARFSKQRELTEIELQEQKVLREEYRALFRANLTGQLERTYIVRPDGTKQKLKKNED